MLCVFYTFGEFLFPLTDYIKFTDFLCVCVVFACFVFWSLKKLFVFLTATDLSKFQSVGSVMSDVGDLMNACHEYMM